MFTKYTKYSNFVKNKILAPLFLIFSSICFIQNVSNEYSTIVKPNYNISFYRNIFVFLGSLGCTKYVIKLSITNNIKLQESVESFLFYTYNTLVLHRCLSN